MPDLNQIVMVLECLIVFAVGMLQIVSLPLLRVKSFVFHLPSSSAQLCRLLCIRMLQRQICQKQKGRRLLARPLWLIFQHLQFVPFILHSRYKIIPPAIFLVFSPILLAALQALVFFSNAGNAPFFEP